MELSNPCYRYHREVKIKIRTAAEVKGKMRYCQSPVFQTVPGCGQCFYSCEYEEHYGPVKHLQGMKKYSRIKPGTCINCRDLPLEYCQNLIDKNNMICKHCGQKIDFVWWWGEHVKTMKSIHGPNWTEGGDDK